MSVRVVSCEAFLLGRQAVHGTPNADSLASLIRLLQSRRGASVLSRKCRLRCSRVGVEIRPVRRQDDEGFESDDDTVSQTSSDSNSSSSTFCLVEDHVIKCERSPGPEAVGIDSANSSGISDNDDGDNSLTPTHNTSNAPTTVLAVTRTKKPTVDDCTTGEAYAFGDVAFCHTDTTFPKVLVLVIKKKSKLNSDDIDSVTGLEAVIFQCNSVENLREICASYKEFSRRLKMDLQFRYPHRRKDSVTDNSPSTLYRNVFNDLQKSMSSNSAAAHSPFFKTWISNVSDKQQDSSSQESSRYNLVQRTDDDGVTHIEVSKAVAGEYVTSQTADEYSGSSSIISISTPDVGNLFLSPSTQSPYPSLSETPADSSEIEGVIRADVESSLTDYTNNLKNVKSSISVDGNENTKNTSFIDNSSPTDNVDIPPQRPQRGKYVKKTKTKESPETSVKSKMAEKDIPVSSSLTLDSSKHSNTHEKVVRGQFIRINVEQQANPGSGRPCPGSRLFGSDKSPSATAGQMSYPVWSLPSSHRSRCSREDESDYHSTSGTGGRKSYHRRSRSSGSGRRSSSPQARTLAYRYIEPAPVPSTPVHKRFFGKLREIANINNAYSGTLSRRRNSSGDLATAQFYHYLEPALKTSVSKSSSNLKSVIKKKNCNETIEPKKVTFSAYATVQVVD